MAPISAYPRSTLRAILKTWSPSGSATLSKQFDAVAFVAYLSFLQRLAKEARKLAEDENGTANRKGKIVIGKKEMRKAKKVSLEGLVFDERCRGPG